MGWLGSHLSFSFQLFSSYEEAETGVKQIEDEYREKAEAALKFVQPPDDQRQGAGDEEWDEEGGPPLRAIAEEDEENMEPRARISESQESASQTQGALGATGSLGKSTSLEG